MLKSIQNISFGGIYDIQMPNNTQKAAIEAKAKDTENAIKEYFGVDNIDSIKLGIKVQTNATGIRIVTAVDNPWFMTSLFKRIGGQDLANEYVNRNIQRYKIDINA